MSRALTCQKKSAKVKWKRSTWLIGSNVFVLCHKICYIHTELLIGMYLTCIETIQWIYISQRNCGSIKYHSVRVLKRPHFTTNSKVLRNFYRIVGYLRLIKDLEPNAKFVISISFICLNASNGIFVFFYTVVFSRSFMDASKKLLQRTATFGTKTTGSNTRRLKMI